MDLTIETRVLREALQKAQLVARRGSDAIPILTCVLLTASRSGGENGSLVLETSNGDQRLTLEIEDDQVLRVAAAGQVAVPAAELGTLTKVADRGSQMRLREVGPRLHIEAGAARWRLGLQPADQFPGEPPRGPEWRGRSEGLMTALALAAPYMCQIEERYYLHGVHLRAARPGGTGLLVEATDTAIAIARHTDWGAAETGPAPVADPRAIVPADTVAMVQRLFEKASITLSGVSDNWIAFEGKRQRLWSRLVDGDYPDTDASIFMERTYGARLRVDAAELRSRIEQVAPVSTAAGVKRPWAWWRLLPDGRLLLAGRANESTGAALVAVELDREIETPIDFKIQIDVATRALDTLGDRKVEISVGQNARVDQIRICAMDEAAGDLIVAAPVHRADPLPPELLAEIEGADAPAGAPEPEPEPEEGSEEEHEPETAA
jgi:DNA polymerase-3 subunit beta